MKTMKMYITTIGDRSVCIFPAEFTIKSNLVVDKENREELRKDFMDAIRTITDDTIANAHFDDECPDCNRVLNEAGRCPNDGCISLGQAVIAARERDSERK